LSTIAVSPDTGPRAHASYEALGPEIDRLLASKGFRGAVEGLDVQALRADLDTMTSELTSYNAFHADERRLWSMRLGRPQTPENVEVFERFEAAFMETIPTGRQAYVRAFEAADRAAQGLERAGMGDALADSFRPFLATLATPSHPYADAVLGYFRHIGCSQSMIDEFLHSFKPINFDFYGHFGGGLSEIRELSQRGVQAQLEIIDHTAEHGFDYLRGACGPPAWAVTASEILAAAGISISAWIVVAIIAALVALLILICELAAKGTWVGNACASLSLLLPVIAFA
jgi:hypothetical protein